MVGIAGQEGRLIYAELLYDMGSDSFGEEDYARALLGLTGSEALAREAVAEFPLDESGATVAEAFADVATLAHYRCPLGEMAGELGRFTPTYLYEYQVSGPLVSERIELGAYHGADADTLFGGGYREPLPAFGPEQRRAAKTLRGYVAQFMRSGNPNGAGLPDWPRHESKSDNQHLVFDDAPHADSGLRESACRFWREQEWEALPRF